MKKPDQTVFLGERGPLNLVAYTLCWLTNIFNRKESLSRQKQSTVAIPRTSPNTTGPGLHWMPLDATIGIGQVYVSYHHSNLHGRVEFDAKNGAAKTCKTDPLLN
jgi:hypothetical protein